MVLLAVFGCKKNEIAPANAVASENSTMTFAAVGAEPQILPVYADGYWVAECVDEWLEISPMSGSGNTEVTVTVADNTIVVEGKTVTNLPRRAKVLLKGGSSDPNQNGTVIINQKGDTYFGKPELSVAEFMDVDEGEDCKLLNVVVSAVADDCIVVSDETGCVLVQGSDPEAVVGAKVILGGKKSTVNGVPAMVLDVTTVVGKAEAEYPTAKDITSTVDAYNPENSEYVSVAGSIVGFAEEKILADAALRIGGASKEVALLNQKSTKEYAQYNYHSVVLEGYCVGLKDGSPALVIVDVKKDNGVDESVIPVTPVPGAQVFYDDFSWLDPIVDEYRKSKGEDKVGDTVGSANKSADAPNIWNTAILKEVFAPAFAAKGYTDLNIGESLCYLQPGYLKFSRTGGHNTALQLKVPTLPSSPTDVDIKFEYCMMVQADGTVDAGPVGVLLLGDGQFANGSALSPGNTSKQNKDQFLWNETAVMKAKGVTSRTKFVFLMHRVVTDENGELVIDEATGEPKFNWAVSGAGRFFIDNIDIKVSGPDVDPVYANIVADAKVLTYEGTGGEQVLKVTSDHDFTLEASEDWITFDKTEGLADEETEITVTCAESELSVLRKAVITISSADSKFEVPVVQSAAGQDIDPMISISKANVTMGAAGGDVTVNVQATGEYTVTPDVAWISIKEPEVTKTMVEKTSVSFVIEENTDMSADREGHVVFSLDGKDIQAVLNIKQNKAKPADPSLLFKDDFAWMKPFIEAYNTGKTPEKVAADFVNGTYADLAARISAGNTYSPNMYTTYADTFPAALAAAGYTDINATAKVIYAQGTEENPYLKFCKGNVQGGISFQPLKENQEYVKVSLDWAIHMTASALDVVHLQLKIQGDGEFLNGTKTSDAIDCDQKAVGDVKWTHSEVIVKGATASTVIAISSKEGFDGSFAASGQHRFYIDNLEVRKYDVVWNDDFSWLDEMIAEYNATATTPVGNAVEGHEPSDYAAASSANAPNAYTAEPFASKFPAALAAAGYTDMNASGKVIYPQDTYLKFGKTSVHTSLQFAPFTGKTSAADYTMTFDWCRHVQGTATIDPVELVVVIEGDGSFANGKKVSDALTTAQKYTVKDDAAGEPGSAEMFWTRATVKIVDATANTKLNIVYKDCLKDDGTYNWKVSGAHRYHLDNIRIVAE